VPPRGIAPTLRRADTVMHENDPLWRLRHALVGVGLALLLSVFIAAFAGAFLGDVIVGDSYGARVGFYSALLLYVVVGAGMLFAKVARHETRPVSAGRLALWVASLWLWPGLWWVARGRSAQQPVPPSGSSAPDDRGH
jgi:hypothetical protein